MTGDPKRVTCHRLCFVMVSRHLVMLAMQSSDMLYYGMCFPNLPVTHINYIRSLIIVLPTAESGGCEWYAHYFRCTIHAEALVRVASLHAQDAGRAL